MQLAELRTMALALHPDEREKLAHALIASLADEPADINQIWMDEIDRRMEEAATGSVAMLPYDQFRDELRKSIGW